jgi:hypothetical protein
MIEEDKELKSRIHMLCFIAIVIFISAAKILKPYEDEIQSYGIVGMMSIGAGLIFLCLLIEWVIYKIRK